MSLTLKRFSFRVPTTSRFSGLWIVVGMCFFWSLLKFRIAWRKFFVTYAVLDVGGDVSHLEIMRWYSGFDCSEWCVLYLLKPNDVVAMRLRI